MKKHELTQILAQHKPSNSVNPTILHGLGVLTGLFLAALTQIYLRSEEESSFQTIYKMGVLTTIGLLVVGVLRKLDNEIESLRAILVELETAGVADEADLPEPVLDKIREIIWKANSVPVNEKQLNITKTLKEIYAKVYVNEVSNWATSKITPIIDDCGNLEINAHPNQLQLDRLPEAPLLVLCEYVDAENRRTKSLSDPIQQMPSLRNYSRRLFNASTGQNAWIHALINHVVRGQQDQAETLLKKYPELTRQNAWVKDFHGRFMRCTAYQRARWDGDWYMWQMIERYMNPEEIVAQRAALENSGFGQYGSSFDFHPLLDRYKSYIKRVQELHAQQNTSDDEIATLQPLWVAVCQEQAKLPFHVIHQFMHPNRSFLIEGGPPKFNELTLPRNTRKMANLFSKRELKFGPDFGLLRFDGAEVIFGSKELGGNHLFRQDGMLLQIVEVLSIDFAALNCLAKVISNHLEQTPEQTPSHNLSSSL